jgi:hypothetical protein
MDDSDRGAYRKVSRAALVLMGVVTLAIVTVGWCLDDRSDVPQTLVQRFTELMDHRDAAGAAELTSYPDAAAASIRQLFAGMGPGRGDYRLSQVITLNPDDAFFTVNVAWKFGHHRDWAYSVQGSAHKLAVGWRIAWNPQLLLPGLGQGRTAALVKTYAPAPQILSAGGLPLMTQQTVNVVTLDPAKTHDRAASANAVAAALAPVASLITAPSILAALDAAHGKPITVVVLRDDVDELVGPNLDGIPGVTVARTPKLIAVDREIWSPLLDSFTGMWQASRNATAGWGIQLFDTSDNPVAQLAGYQGPAGPDITATLDPQLQLAAENAVVSAATAATIVAIRPSSGAVLAVAQNDPADRQGPVALTGLYPAGDTLDLFSAGAAAAKDAQPQDVSREDIDDTLNSLGIGADVHTAGLTAVTGRVPHPRHIEAVLQGQQDGIRVSPFGMALAAAAIARGSMPQPMIAYGQSPVQSAQPAALPDSAVAALREMVRQQSANPEYAVHLAAYPGLVGYTGYAGDDQWFLGYRGDLAFAVHIADATDNDGGDAAARMAAWMFQSLAQP